MQEQKLGVGGHQALLAYSNLLSPLQAQNKDITTASQLLLTKVKLHLQCRLEKNGLKEWNILMIVLQKFASL